MDSRRQYPDPTGQGIELHSRPAYQELQHPGIEATQPSTLEVVTPRQDLSHNKTWEKMSGLPEAAYYAGTPQTVYSSVAPAYEYNSPYDQRPLVPPSPAPVAADRKILGLKRQTFWIILSLGIFVAVVAIAAGVGVGVALKSSSDSPAAR